RFELPKLRWSRTFVLVCAAVFIALYVVVVLLYAQGGRTDEGTPVDNSHDAVHVVLTPRDVDAGGDRITVELRFAPGSTLVSDDGMTATEDFRLFIPAASLHQGQVLSFEAGDTVAPIEIALRTTGAIERWPFDTHPAGTMLLVSTH